MPINTDRPIFIVSSPRSGSTLLRLILDAHPNIAIPPPGYLFNMIYPYLYSYGDLNKKENFAELIEDILEAPTIKKWKCNLNIASIISNVGECSFKGVYEYLHVIYMNQQGKIRWGNKSPRNVHFISDIKELFPKAQIIHLLRDGRDVAIDIADADFWPHSLWGGAQRWQECVRAARIFSRELDSDSYMEVRYESLCQSPESVLRQVCEFIGETFAPEILAHHESSSTRSWSQDKTHQATAKPITTEYVGMYKRRLNQHDRQALEALTGETLRQAGYPVDGNASPIPFRLATQINEGDAVSAMEKAEYKTWHKKKRMERRQRGVWKDEDRKTKLWGMV